MLEIYVQTDLLSCPQEFCNNTYLEYGFKLHRLDFFGFLKKGTASRPHLVVGVPYNSLIKQVHI